jgi:dTDP-glucose pyrophosphorylase
MNHQMKPSLLIMAAGIGSRYGGIKQLDPFGPSGEKIVDYTIYDAIRAGFGKIVFIIRHDIEKNFREMVTNRWLGRIQMEFVYQELQAIPEGFSVPSERIKPWGTGHAILTAASLIREQFSAVNADDFYGRSSLKKTSDFLSEIKNADGAEYCLVGYKLKHTLSEYGSVARGVCRADADGYLTSLVETTNIFKNETGIFHKDENGEIHTMDGDSLVSMNLWGFTPSFFRRLDDDFQVFLKRHGHDPKAEFYLTHVVDRLIRTGEGKVKVLNTDQQWFGVTYREDRPMVERSIRELTAQGEYPSNLWE